MAQPEPKAQEKAKPCLTFRAREVFGERHETEAEQEAIKQSNRMGRKRKIIEKDESNLRRSLRLKYKKEKSDQLSKLAKVPEPNTQREAVEQPDELCKKRQINEKAENNKYKCSAQSSVECIIQRIAIPISNEKNNEIFRMLFSEMRACYIQEDMLHIIRENNEYFNLALDPWKNIDDKEKNDRPFKLAKIVESVHQSIEDNKVYKTFDSLPIEVLEKILSYETVSYTELCSLACTSRCLNTAISRINDAWRLKFAKMWPTIDKYYTLPDGGYRELFASCMIFRRNLRSMLNRFMTKYYSSGNIADEVFDDLSDACDNLSFSEYFLLDELSRIVFDPEKNTNLTLKFYAGKALKYLTQHTIKSDFLVAIEKEEKMPLLKGACYLYKFYEPTTENCTSQVIPKINELLKAVFSTLKEQSPSHPLVITGYSPITDETGLENRESLWEFHECRAIIDAINTTLFEKLNWKPVSYINLNSPKLVFMDKVIENKVGSTVTQVMIYAIIAAQFGVKLDLVLNHKKFLLKLACCENLPESCIFIDVSIGGRIKTLGDLRHRMPPSVLTTVSSNIALGCMCREMMRSYHSYFYGSGDFMFYKNCAELLSILWPDDTDNKTLLMKLYIHLKIDYSNVLCYLGDLGPPILDPAQHYSNVNLMHSFANPPEDRRRYTKYRKPKRRSELTQNFKFFVGCLVTYRNVRCVVTAWNPISEEIDVYTKYIKPDEEKKQPFYHLLGSDGKFHYAAQDSITIDLTKKPIDNPVIGRYFESFHGHYYMPNKAKRLEYPDDVLLLKAFYKMVKPFIWMFFSLPESH